MKRSDSVVWNVVSWCQCILSLLHYYIRALNSRQDGFSFVWIVMQRRWDFIPVVISSEFCLCLVFEPCSFIRKSRGEGGIDVDYCLLGFQLFLVKTQRGPCATTQKKRVLALVVIFWGQAAQQSFVEKRLLWFRCDLRWHFCNVVVEWIIL